MKRSLMGVLLCLGLLLSSLSAFAQESGSGKIGQTVKEIFMKGSIDGKSLFMVYGFGNYIQDAGDIAKTMQNPIDGDDLVDLGKMFYNKDHDEDFVDAAKMGAKGVKPSLKWSGKGIKNIAKLPWKTLKKIPGSYKVSFDNARDSYYHANNPITGVLKYAGHAIWANVKGAYYLVVEAPIMMAAGVGQTVLGAAGAVLSVPAALAFQGLNIAFEALDIAIKFSWRMIKNAGRAAGIVISGAYSLASSGIATTAALITAGGIAAYKGAKWVIVDLPKNLIRPVKAKILTSIELDDQEEFAKRVLDTLKDVQIGHTVSSIKDSVKEYSSKLVLTLKVGSKAVKAIVIKLGIKNKLVQIKAEATRKYLKALRKLPENEGKKRKEVKEQVREQLEELISVLAAS